MPRSIPSVRILPMSSTLDGFRDRTIADVQAKLFLRSLPGMKGRWRYPRVGLNAVPGTVVLFQFQARIVASAVFVRDEKLARPRGGYGGVLHFEPASLRTFDPVDAETMRKAWPAFRAFGHVRQYLNPTRYGLFKRRLRNVMSPPTSSPSPVFVAARTTGRGDRKNPWLSRRHAAFLTKR